MTPWTTVPWSTVVSHRRCRWGDDESSSESESPRGGDRRRRWRRRSTSTGGWPPPLAGMMALLLSLASMHHYPPSATAAFLPAFAPARTADAGWRLAGPGLLAATTETTATSSVDGAVDDAPASPPTGADGDGGAVARGATPPRGTSAGAAAAAAWLAGRSRSGGRVAAASPAGRGGEGRRGRSSSSSGKRRLPGAAGAVMGTVRTVAAAVAVSTPSNSSSTSTLVERGESDGEGEQGDASWYSPKPLFVVAAGDGSAARGSIGAPPSASTSVSVQRMIPCVDDEDDANSADAGGDRGVGSAGGVVAGRAASIRYAIDALLGGQRTRREQERERDRLLEEAGAAMSAARVGVGVGVGVAKTSAQESYDRWAWDKYSGTAAAPPPQFVVGDDAATIAPPLGPQPGEVLVHPTTSHPAVTVRVARPGGRDGDDDDRFDDDGDDPIIAELRLGVFSNYSAHSRRGGKFHRMSRGALRGRRRRGATCLVATVPRRYLDHPSASIGVPSCNGTVGGHLPPHQELSRWPAPSAAVVRNVATADADTAESDEVIVGTVECSRHEFYGTALGESRGAGTVLYVTEVAVSPSARRCGVGMGLLRGVDRFATAGGVETVYLHVDVDNVAAAGLYRKAGYGAAGDDGDDELRPMMHEEFTRSLNLHDGATGGGGRRHLLLCRDLVDDPVVLPLPTRPRASLGFEVPA